MYVANHDIEASQDCMVVATVKGFRFIAEWNGNDAEEKVGTSSEPLLRGRIVEIADSTISMTADTRIIRSPFTVS
jgi:hypothetical protein